MIERWSEEDAKLLIGSHITWRDFTRWKAVSARNAEEGWILILENANGETTTLSAGQMANGPIVWGPRPQFRTHSTRLKSGHALHEETRRAIRVIQLTMRSSYA